MGAKGKSAKTAFCILSAAILALAFPSCMKKESYPIVPQIEFAGYYNIFYDSSKIARKGVLTISFTDGDGDLGLHDYDLYPPFDSLSPYFYNYFIDQYLKINGAFVLDTSLVTPLRYRIPYLTPDDPNKAIKGIIVDTLPLNPKPVHDTIKFSMYIYDRALHKSNVVFTPEIIVRRP